jgi:Chitin binding Peritrophin-A domain
MPQECALGAHFSRVLGRCDLAEFTPCFLNTCKNIRGGTGLAPSPEKCEEYFYCSEGLQVSHGQCPAGMSFDIRTNRCVRERDGSCYPGSVLRSIHPAYVPIAANA